MTVSIKEKDAAPSKQKTPEELEEENKNFLDILQQNNKSVEPTMDEVENDKLAELKAKLAAKQKQEAQAEKLEESVPTLVAKKEVSISMAVIGVGQAGGRIAEKFNSLGYDVGIINTSSQDLEYVNVLSSQKLLLTGSLGGTGKDLDLGREIFSASEGQISDFVDEVIEGNDMIILAISGGGGSGSSSVDTMVPLLHSKGAPVGVIYVLPKATEDASSKKNSIETLSRLAKMTSENMISSLVVVDNARVEQIYGGLSQSQFWSAANSAIVEPIHLFNTLTSQPSKYVSMDPSDFSKIVAEGDCSIYGMVEVEDYLTETSLAEAVIQSLSGNMLASGFDLTQTRVGGVIIVGSEKVLDQIPAINIDYCFSMISEQTNGASIFQGIYSQPGDEDVVKIYSWFAGLGLPVDRIENLKKESKAQAAVQAEKEKSRGSAMNLDLGEDKITTVKDEIQRKIQKKNSGFNKFQGGGIKRESIIDKRRK